MKFQMVKYYIIFLFFTISCSEEEDAFEYYDNPSSLIEVYDSFWWKMSTNYLFWDIDPTNWDKINNQYKPLFKDLNINNQFDVQKAITYFKEMTINLIDGHFILNMNLPNSRSISYQPNWERKQKNNTFHDIFYYQKIVTKYLDKPYYNSSDTNNIKNGTSLKTITGFINNNILYLKTNRFSLLKSYSSNTDNEVQKSLKFFFNQLKRDNLKGVVLDVRGTSGGDLGDLNFLMGNLINQPLHFGYTQYKNDIGKTDYTPWLKAYLNPQTNSTSITNPIIVLTDNYTASLSEFIALAVKSMPNGTIIGEKTWGATGVIAPEKVYNSGQFSIGNFLNVKISSVKFKCLNEKIYEGTGVPPDILISFNLSELNNNRDLALEKAIETIKHNN